MREVESESKMRHLIEDRSNQATTKQRFVSTSPQIWSKRVEVSVQNASAPLPRPIRIVLLFTGIIFEMYLVNMNLLVKY